MPIDHRTEYLWLGNSSTFKALKNLKIKFKHIRGLGVRGAVRTVLAGIMHCARMCTRVHLRAYSRASVHTLTRTHARASKCTMHVYMHLCKYACTIVHNLYIYAFRCEIDAEIRISCIHIS